MDGETDWARNLAVQKFRQIIRSLEKVRALRHLQLLQCLQFAPQTRPNLWHNGGIPMPNPKSTSTILRLATIAVAGVLTCGIPSAAQSQAPKEGAVELEQSLFLLKPHLKNPKGVEIPGVLEVVSVPLPIQKYCMGKTSEQCSTIDYCIRTTTKSVAMCQKLPANLRNLPPYPAGMRPNRQFSISFYQGAPNIKGFEALRQFYDHAPKGTLEVLSTHARFNAKIRFTKTADDGDFQLLEVLSVPSS